LRWEVPVSLQLEGLTLAGYADLVGEDFVLDFKTDKAVVPEHYEVQLWAY